MKNMEDRLERLIKLTAPDTLTLQLEDGGTAELTREDVWDALIELFFALRERRDPWETETMGIIEKAEPGQFPMVDLVQALIVSVKMHYYKQMEGEHYGEGDVENDQG
jgi:hypothetical protein